MAEKKHYGRSEISRHVNALYLELPKDIANINADIVEQLWDKIYTLDGVILRAKLAAFDMMTDSDLRLEPLIEILEYDNHTKGLSYEHSSALYGNL
jgi:hypothetical protein